MKKKMMKKEKAMTMTPHIIVTVVALVAIVSISALALHIPKGWSNAAWATTGHPQLEYPGAPSDSASGNLKEMGSFCTQDSQCASGDCSIVFYAASGKQVPGLKVCS